MPRVLTIAARPFCVMPMNACGREAESIASVATCTDPSVPFLNPTGHDVPLASSR